MNRSAKGLAVVLDIGSGSVGGAMVFYSPKTSKPKILYTFRSPIIFREELDLERFTRATLAALKIVLEKLEKAGVGTPENVFCFLASPWVVGQTRTIKLKKNTPFKFTESLAQSYIQKEIRNFENSHLKRFEEAGQKMRLLEKEYFQTRLNGYKTNKPLGQKTGSFEMDLFVSLAPEKILSLIERQIRKYFNLKVGFRSFMLTSFLALRDLFPHQTDYLILDIAGEVTDLSRVKEETLVESVSFPLGRSLLTATLSARLNKDEAEAETILNLFLANKLETKLENIVNEALKEVSSGWLRSFTEALAKLSGRGPIPSTIFVTVDPEVASFFEKTIKREEWGQSFLINQKFNVIIISNKILSSAISVSEKGALDPFLSLESFFIKRILQ